MAHSLEEVAHAQSDADDHTDSRTNLLPLCGLLVLGDELFFALHRQDEGGLGLTASQENDDKGT